MSNLGSLPQIPAGTTITIVSNADWLDSFYVQAPGFSVAPVAVLGTLNGTTSVVVAAVDGLVPGGLVIGYGIPPGTTIASINAGTKTLTLSQAATVTATNVPLAGYGPPLDLTGITFRSTLRPTAQSGTVLLDASTTNGLMTNGGVTGTFGWNVPAAKLPNWPAGLVRVGLLNCVADVAASDASGSIVNMCALSGPLPVSVVLAESR